VAACVQRRAQGAVGGFAQRREEGTEGNYVQRRAKEQKEHVSRIFSKQKSTCCTHYSNSRHSRKYLQYTVHTVVTAATQESTSSTHYSAVSKFVFQFCIVPG